MPSEERMIITKYLQAFQKDIISPFKLLNKGQILSGHVFGSLINGFTLAGSDIDFTIMTRESQVPFTSLHNLKANKETEAQILNQMHRYMTKNHPYLSLKYFPWAQFPIIKVAHKLKFNKRPEMDVNLDITVNNLQGLKNSRLIGSLAEEHPLFQDLGCFVKIWSKKKAVAGTRDVFPSSYAYLSLVMSFLKENNLINLQNPGHCHTAPFYDVVTEFFTYYASQSPDCFSCIEDPFDTSTEPFTKCYLEGKQRQVRAAMRNAARALRHKDFNHFLITRPSLRPKFTS